MYCWRHRTKQILSCKSCHTFWLLNHCFDAIFHWLYFLNILWILDFYSAIFYILYHLIVAFCLIFHYFAIFFVFFNYYHHFFFNYLNPPSPCSYFSLFFIDFTLLLFHLIHAFSLIFICFFVLFCFVYFWTFFLWFSCRFLVTNAFSMDFLLSVAFYFFSWKFLAAFMLCDCYFLLQCNLTLNYFWLTSSGGCPNYTFRRHILQGIHNQGG